MKRIFLALAVWTGLSAWSSIAYATTCAIDPTNNAHNRAATSRFGIHRNYYNGGKGGGHSGVDLRAPTGTKLYAPFDGVVTQKGFQPRAGNLIAIKNAEGHVVWYMHLSGFAKDVNIGTKVTAGQLVGLAGGTGGNYVPHLHMEYTVPKKEDARNTVIYKGMTREQLFGAQRIWKQKSDGNYITDPGGYMCDAFPFVHDAARDNAVLGKDTREQYEILYGGAVPGGITPASNVQYTDAQVATANAAALLANAEGQSVAEFLSDRDGYGSLPGASQDKYEDMSPSEMMARESKRRMTDAQWHDNLTKVSSRALWVDYLQTIAVGNYMQEAIVRKRERVEGLLAALLSQEIEPRRHIVDDARDRAVRQAAANAVK